MPLHLDLPVPAMDSSVPLAPGVFGIFKPVLLLPEGITDYLTPAQLQTIVAHELCHVRRRDNLIAAIHIIVEATFWFYPLVWWIRRPLIEERERACDEEVLHTIREPQTYAEAILNVCKFCVTPPVVCASVVTGSNLTKRIEVIMANPVRQSLNPRRKLMLAAAAAASVAIPIIIGIEAAPLSRAQRQGEPAAAAFDVASVRPATLWKSGGEGSKRSRIEYTPESLTMRNVDLSECVQWAYCIKWYQLSGAKALTSDRYDILAKTEASVSSAQLRLMLRDLLAKRFKLTLHRESKLIPVYELVRANGRLKLPSPKPDTETGASRAIESLPRVQDDSFVFQDSSMAEFAEKLSQLRGIDRPVVDRTGIDGIFDITLKSAPSAIRDPNGPSLFTLVQEQLGLKLVSGRAPIDVLIIDRAEKPSEN